MSFSDSNGNNKRLGAFGKILKDIQVYTKSQGKQVCSMVKSTDLIPSSLKQSQTSSGNKTFFGRGVSGQVKHKSLKEEDETILWDSEYEDERFPYHNNNNDNNYSTGHLNNNQNNHRTSANSTNHYTHNGNTGWIDSNGNFRTSKSEKNWTKGIRIPFLK